MIQHYMYCALVYLGLVCIHRGYTYCALVYLGGEQCVLHDANAQVHLGHVLVGAHMCK